MSEQPKNNGQVTLLQTQLNYFSGSFLEMVDGLSDEVLHHQPAGKANSIAATVGHVLVVVDSIVNGLLSQQAPIFTTMPTGLSELPPSGAELFNWYEWVTRVTINLAEASEYGTAVFQSMNAYLETLSDEQLHETIQTPAGENSIFGMLGTVVLSNLAVHAGEIATLKGQHNLKGYSM